MKIAIYDDEYRKRKKWRQRLEKLDCGDVFAIDDHEFKTEVEKLEERRKSARRADLPSLGNLGIESLFDEIDILIIDYDLLKKMDLTGEEVAYLLRCFSTCGLVVALNQYGDQYDARRCDLTLRAYPESFADLNIGESSLDDLGLWETEHWREFRPWYWPILPDMLENYRMRVGDANRWLERPILQSLSLDEDSAGILPRNTLEFIQSRGDVEHTTFKGFVMHSGKGLKRRDAGGAIDELIPRIAAARLHRWLESFVLGAQDALVDAPHLAMRFPSLLQGDVADSESWNRTARVHEIAGIHRELLGSCEFPYSHWLSRPAWYWSKARTNRKIQEVGDPWSIEKHDWVFCEDSSRFVRRSDAHGFVADLPAKNNRRYAERLDSVEYHPSVRFSL